MNRNLAVAIFAAILTAFAGPGNAASAAGGSSFAVTQLYSNASGDSQFIQLEELSGSDGQDQLTGSAISVTNTHGVTKTFPFPNGLASAKTAHTRVLIVSGGLAATLAPSFADYVMPDQFLPTDGGVVSFAGTDSWNYASLPTSGASLTRDRANSDGLMRNFAGASTYPLFGADSIYEFYNVKLDHYFVSGTQPDIDALDSGRISGWARTGELLYAPALPAALSLPVCRFYLPTGSHFFSVSPEECEDVAERFPSFILETRDAFLSWLPQAVSGKCPILPEGEANVTLVPVYRLWNNRPDTNHRYTPDLQVRAAMMSHGWIPEGYGPMGVGLCMPSVAAF